MRFVLGIDIGGTNLVVGSVAVAVYGWLPRWSGVGWGVLAVCFVIGWLGGLREPLSLTLAVRPWAFVREWADWLWLMDDSCGTCGLV